MTSSEALRRILPYVQAFREGVSRCRKAPAFNQADLMDAFNRLSRLKDRYIHEEAELDQSEREALEKVFRHDNFIDGLIDIRQIGEHVQKRTPAHIPLFTSARVPLHAETSAGSFFAGPVYRVDTPEGTTYLFNLQANLEEAEKRIEKAVNRAIASTP
jgi:hypothetical protein